MPGPFVMKDNIHPRSPVPGELSPQATEGVVQAAISVALCWYEHPLSPALPDSSPAAGEQGVCQLSSSHGASSSRMSSQVSPPAASRAAAMAASSGLR